MIQMEGAMAWYWYVLLMVVLASVYFHFTGKPGFWKLTRKFPEEALQFFESEPENWLVFYDKPQGGYRSVAPLKQWSGPFSLHVPRLPNNVVIYGRQSQIEVSQERFVALMKSRIRA